MKPVTAAVVYIYPVVVRCEQTEPELIKIVIVKVVANEVVPPFPLEKYLNFNQNVKFIFIGLRLSFYIKSGFFSVFGSLSFHCPSNHPTI